jgi:hypothetical protein
MTPGLRLGVFDGAELIGGGSAPLLTLFGVEVSTERGDWRTLMLPTDIQQLDLISKG